MMMTRRRFMKSDWSVNRFSLTYAYGAFLFHRLW